MNEKEHKNDKPVGLFFKEAREKKGLTLTAVHDTTKIPLDVLRAIEEGYTVRTLSSFYEKAFKKKYAEYLEMDLQDVLDDHHPNKPADPYLETDEIQETIHKTIDQLFNKKNQKKAAKVAGILFAVFILGRMAGCLIEKSAQRSSERRSEIKREKVVAQQQAKVPEKKEQEKHQETRPARNIVPQPRSKPQAAQITEEKVLKQDVSLTIKARKRCWIQVKVDGNLVFRSSLNEGASESWDAEDIIEISGKNIHSLDFEVNGKVLSGLGRSDRNARRVVITKKGLTVKD